MPKKSKDDKKKPRGEHAFMHAFDSDEEHDDQNDISLDLEFVELSDSDDPELVKQAIEDTLARLPSPTISTASGSSYSSLGSAGSSDLPGVRKVRNVETSSWRARVTIDHKEYNIYTSRDKTEASLAYIYARMQLQDLITINTRVRESDLFINFDKHILRYPHLISKVDIELGKIRANNPGPSESKPRVKRGRPGM